MALDTSIIGKPTGARKVRVERGPVEFFATVAARTTTPCTTTPARRGAAGFSGIPAPPTFSFVMGHQGARREEQPPDPTGGAEPDVQGHGRAHERAAGSCSTASRSSCTTGRSSRATCCRARAASADLYEKESKGSIMTFIVMETEWTRRSRASRSSPRRFNLIHRRKA